MASILHLESQEKYTAEQKERKKQAKAALGEDTAELEEVTMEVEDAEEDGEDLAAKMPHMLIGNKPDLPIEKSCRGDKAGSIQVFLMFLVSFRIDYKLC